MSTFSKVVICGGSFARALRRAGAVKTLTGLGRSAASLERARALGVIDEAATDWAQALDGADLVLLAAPVGATDALVTELAQHLPPHTVVTDAGSTKSDVAAVFAARLSPEQRARVVPAHPIAGAEKSGVEAASASLFDGRRVVLTPLPESSPEAIERVTRAFALCGAHVSSMSPKAHDETFAAVSHLPHLLAFALVDEFASRANASELFRYAGSGFRDFTRIASSHPEMWRDIALANRGNLLEELDRYSAALSRLRSLLEAQDATALEALFQHAKDARSAWLDTLAAG
jgi:prephenate dehydrogenase